jgi:tetratricopeptide (TPR) repeat protein
VPLLEDLLRTYQHLARAAGDFPRLQPQAAEANYRIGDICQRLGRADEAARAYQASIDLYTTLVADSSDPDVRIKLARAYNERGRTVRTLQKLDEAARMHERAIHTLGDAPREFTDRPECRYELARACFLLGRHDMMLSPGRPGPPGEPGRGPPDRPRRGGKRGRRPPPDPGPGPDGEHPAGRAVALLEGLIAEFPKVPEYRHLLACCYRDLPPERFGRGRPAPGARTDRAVDLLERLVEDFPRVPDYCLDLCETLARPGPRSGGPGGRQQRLRRAVALSEQLVKQYPNVPDYRAAHARYLDGLGMALREADDVVESEKRHRQAVAIQQRLVRQHREVVAYRFWLGLMERSLGRVLCNRGQWKEARTRLESATARVEGLWKNDARLGGARPFLGMAYRELAEALEHTGEPARAAEARRKADQFGPPRAGPGRGRGPGR